MRHLRLWTAVWLLIGVSVACRGPSSSSTTTAPAPARSRHSATIEYLPGLTADVFLPERRGPVPLVVLIPGGGWLTADPSGLVPLAEALSTSGLAAVTATYRAADADVRFPVPIADVLCAVDAAVARVAADTGAAPWPLVLLGHSSGAHLAALAGLSGGDFRAACPQPPARIDALALLAGIYDISAMPDVVEPLFGARPEQDRAAWHAGNALTWVASNPDLPVFVAHGDADTLVPSSFSTSFADALQSAGHRVELIVVPGAGHHEIYQPSVIARPLETWIAYLPRE